MSTMWNYGLVGIFLLQVAFVALAFFGDDAMGYSSVSLKLSKGQTAVCIVACALSCVALATFMYYAPVGFRDLIKAITPGIGLPYSNRQDWPSVALLQVHAAVAIGLLAWVARKSWQFLAWVFGPGSTP